MKSITFDRWEGGVDLRKGASTSDANRLRVLRNAYITQGKVIRKRPGLSLIEVLETGTKGLVGALGKLNTFYDYDDGPISHADSRFQANELVYDYSGGKLGYSGGALSKIHTGFSFDGYLYVVAEYDDEHVAHHYLNDPATAPTRVTDANCPQSKVALKLVQKVFAIDPENDQVRFSKTGDPKDWSALDDADFLPTGLRASGSERPFALGEYQGDLCVFMADSMQLWRVDPNPDLISMAKNLGGVGTVYPGSVRQFAGDIVFLSKAGFRSVTQQYNTENLQDVDIGSAIDLLVRDILTPVLEVKSEYFPALGQLWEMVNRDGKATIYVYAFSKTAKISAWQEFTFGFEVQDITSLDGSIHLRSGNNVYKVDEAENVFTDDGNSYEMRAELPFLDFGDRSSTKYIQSLDMVVDGEVQVQFRYDPNDPSRITDPITVSGDTSPRQSIPVEMTLPAIAPVITSTSGDLVQIESLTFHYEELGPV